MIRKGQVKGAEIIEALNDERFHHPVPLVQCRMEVLWLKSHGLPHEPIAVLGNLSETTLREHFQLYLAGGVEGLKQVHFYHPENEWVQHVNSLEEYFRVNPPASIKQAQSEIETPSGIRRSEPPVREFLKKTSRALSHSRDDPGQRRPCGSRRLS